LGPRGMRIEWTWLHNEELDSLYNSSNKVVAIKCRR